MSKAGNIKACREIGFELWLTLSHPGRDVKWAPGTLPDCGKLKQNRVVKTKLGYLVGCLSEVLEPRAWGWMSFWCCASHAAIALISCLNDSIASRFHEPLQQIHCEIMWSNWMPMHQNINTLNTQSILYFAPFFSNLFYPSVDLGVSVTAISQVIIGGADFLTVFTHTLSATNVFVLFCFLL